MNSITPSEAAKAVVRQNTEDVQGKGNFDVFEELFADDFVDHTTQPGTTPDKAGVRNLYTYIARGVSGVSYGDSLAAGGRRSSDDVQNLLRYARWPIPWNCSDASQNSFRIR